MCNQITFRKTQRSLQQGWHTPPSPPLDSVLARHVFYFVSCCRAIEQLGCCRLSTKTADGSRSTPAYTQVRNATEARAFAALFSLSCVVQTRALANSNP